MRKFLSFLLLGLLLSVGNVWADKVTLQYTTNTTTNMTGNNDAGTVGLDADHWSVVGAKGGNTNFPGLNKNGYIALYYNATASNTITVTNTDGATISSITITYTGNSYNNGKVLVGGNVVAGTSGTYSINASSFVVTNANTSNVQVRISSIEITYSSGAPDPSVATTTTIVATGITNTDVYTGTAAGSLSANVAVTSTSAAIDGATVTWSGDNDDVATIDANTGVVTLVAEGTVTFTASYAGVANQYKSSSDTYEMTVTDSTPFEGEIFDATIDKDLNNTAQGAGSITKNNVTYSCTSGILGNGTEYRMYKNSTTTISTTDGSHITKIEFINAASNPATGFADQTGWSTSDGGGVWEGDAESVSFVASGAQVRASKIKVTVVANANPSISASNVNITYDATAGSIAYTINNPVVGGVLTASIPQGSWLTLGEVGESVPFTCAVNPTAVARTTTVTLTYTYNTTEEVTKEVTITQAGNPDVYDNISDIIAISTSYKVKGTIVATNAKGFVMGDGTGYVYYYKNGAPEQAVSAMVSINGTTGTYGHIIQFTNTATVTSAATSNYNNTPAATFITEVPDYSTGYHLSTYLQFEGFLYKDGNNYFISINDDLIQISYPTEAQKTTMNALSGKPVKVKGYFTGINSSSYFTVMLESVEEIIVTIGTNGWSTFSAPFKFKVTGAEVYMAAPDSPSAATKVVLTKVNNGIVPAEEGVVLKGEQGATVTITSTNDAASDYDDNLNDLMNTAVAPAIASVGSNMYVLATDNNVTAFYPCGNITIPMNKAWMFIFPAAQQAPDAIRIEFAENNATNIQNLEGSEKAVKFIENGQLFILREGVVYDATGRMVK